LVDSTVPPALAELDARAALETLFRDHYRSLLGTARLLVDDPGSAEEVVQDAFVALHRHWPRMRDHGAALGYLRTSVLNGARGRLRRRQTAQRHLRAVPDTNVEAADALAVRRTEREQLVELAPPVIPDAPRADVGVTDDERLLAYTRGGEDSSRIYVLDLTTGETREWATAEDEDDFFLVLGRKFDLAWAPDGRRLAFVNAYEGNELYVLDTAAVATLSDATPLGDINYASPTWIDDSQLAAVGECCYPEFTETRNRVDVLDTATGALVAEGTFGDTQVTTIERMSDGWAYITAEQQVYKRPDGFDEVEPIVIAADGVEVAA
jgi:hypothetical protein